MGVGSAMADSTALAVRQAPARPLVLSEIFRDHAAFVMRTLRRLGVRPADVEDAAQEVFVVVHRKQGQYDGTSLVRSWLFGIATRVASDSRRRAHVRRETSTAHTPEGVVPAPQEEQAMRSQERAILDRAMDELDDAKRAVFVLHELEGLPMVEVAQIVGCPLQTAYSRLHTARERVRVFAEREIGSV